MPTKWLVSKPLEPWANVERQGYTAPASVRKERCKIYRTKNFSMILPCKMTWVFLGFEKEFLWRFFFSQRWIRSKCNFMKRDENELVAKYSPYRAKLSTNITLQNGIKYMGLIQDQWSCPSKNNCKMACARESFHKAVVQREPLYVQANVWKIPSKEKERFFCRLSSFSQHK